MGDITTGYTFKAGEKGVGHTKLNLAVNGGVINATFISGKIALTGSPAKTSTYLLAFDGSVLRKITLASAFFDHDDLLHTRTLATVPLAADEFMIGDSLTSWGVKRITVGNALFGAVEFTSAIAYDDLLPFYDTSGTTIHRVKVGNLFWKLPARAGALIATDEFPVVNTGGTTAEKATLTQLASYLATLLAPAGMVAPYAGGTIPTGWLACDGSAVSRTTYANLFTAIATTHGAGDGSTTFNLPNYRGRTLAGDGTGVWTSTFTADNTNEELTVSSNSTLYTGAAVTVSNSGGALPTGLLAATTYYVIRVSATVVQLASSLANAVAGTAINITTNGTGTHTLSFSLTARTLGQVAGEETHALTTSEIPAHTHTFGLAAANTVGGGDPLAYAGAFRNTSATGGSGAHNIMQPTSFVKWMIKT